MDFRSAPFVRPAKGALRPALQAGSCAEALIELCGRIWLELEQLAYFNARSSASESSSSDLAAQTLRLELLLIIDACESADWACLLDADVRHRLFAMSRDVLAIIAVGSHELTLEIIERAQDRVFDEATDPEWSGLSQANRCVAYS
jgi:GAF domain-containing protein